MKIKSYVFIIVIVLCLDNVINVSRYPSYKSSHTEINIQKYLDINIEKNNISNTADVVVNSDKKINYLYKIFYNKFLENPDKSIQESSKDEFSTCCDNRTSNFYLNGRKNSAHANGQYIGGIPYDKIADLYIEISYSNDNIKKFKLNLTSAVSTVTKNTQIKLGTEYFSIKATGSKDDPSIALYKNYNDFFTNHKISIQIGSFHLKTDSHGISKNSNFNFQEFLSIIAVVVFSVLVLIAIFATIIKRYNIKTLYENNNEISFSNRFSNFFKRSESIRP